MKKISIITAIVFSIIITGCVQETRLKTIYFEVDMRGFQNFESVGVRGYVTNPSWEIVVPLTDEDKDSIYKGVAKRQSAQWGTEFKFVTNDSIYELKDKKNRIIMYEYKPETIIYKATFNNPKSEIIKK